MFDPTAKSSFVRNIVSAEEPLEYDEELTFVTAEVERQLKLGLLIPRYFRNFAIRIVERWWQERYRWNNKGKGLKFTVPQTQHYSAYKVVWLRYKKLEKQNRNATKQAEAVEKIKAWANSHQQSNLPCPDNQAGKGLTTTKAALSRRG